MTDSSETGTGHPRLVNVRGAVLHALSEQQCVEWVDHRLSLGQGGWILTLNVDRLRTFAEQPEYAQLCRTANLVVADGMPLVWSSRLQGTPLPQRVCGSELIWSLSDLASLRGYRVFFLGGNPGTAERTAEVLSERYPRLTVAGVYCPRRGFDDDPPQIEAVRTRLSEAQPDLVFLALGSSREERLIQSMATDHPEAWWIGVGISFSFVSGEIRRAPPWMQRSGLEWLHRWGQEPRRLTSRYFLRGLPFVGGLLLRAVGVGVRRRLLGQPSTRR